MSGEVRFVAAEFFAGIGLVNLGLLQGGIEVHWANDWEPAKAEMHCAHFGSVGDDYVVGDIGNVDGADLPEVVDLAWASFPCTNLSLAGNRAGLGGSESGTFFEWIRILREMDESKPRLVAAENVVGLATSRGGDDLRTAIKELNGLGYSCDLLAIDARRFVPQSRLRMFIVGTLDEVQQETSEDLALRPEWLHPFFSDETLVTHRASLPALPELLTSGFSKLADRIGPGDSRWWEEERTAAFLDSLSGVQADRLESLIARKKISYRTAYRRTRGGVPVWEIRADDIAGCLRTARGGSSKQAVVRAGNGSARVRWMTPAEYTKLMGAPEYNIVGLRPNQVMFGCGDAVVVDVVKWLAENYLGPVLGGALLRALPAVSNA